MRAMQDVPVATKNDSAADVMDGLAENVNAFYDHQMFIPDIEKHSYDFHNYGYWSPGTRTHREASENLVDKLLAFIPEKNGAILDVACGKGATTRHLLRYYPPRRVTGINISSKQIARCRLNVPGCRFLLMDATRLRFSDNSFENVICVESAFHFEPRAAFLREAYRVLKPGGRLVIADILFTEAAEFALVPAVNYVRGPGHYKQLLVDAGYATVEIENATYECWNRFLFQRLRILRNQYAARLIDWRAFIQRTNILLHKAELTKYYVLASAQKAGSGRNSQAG